MPEVWASAAVDRRARPAAAATPRNGKIFRRETILDATSEVMFNLLDFEDPVILVWYLLTTKLIRARPARQRGAGFLASTEFWMIIPLLDPGHHVASTALTWSYCTATVTSVFQVMSTLSPTLTL